MKKGLIAVLIIITLYSIGNATAIDLEIGRELTIEGRGLFDCDLEVQSESGFNGQKLEDALYTRWLRSDSDNAIAYTSNLEVYISNITCANQTAEIYYAQRAQTENTKQLMCSVDYPLGASVGFYSHGDATKQFELFTDPTLSEFDMEGTIDGRQKLMQKVIAPTNYTRYITDITQFEGEFRYAHSTFVELSEFPAGGVKDYLGCP